MIENTRISPFISASGYIFFQYFSQRLLGNWGIMMDIYFFLFTLKVRTMSIDLFFSRYLQIPTFFLASLIFRASSLKDYDQYVYFNSVFFVLLVVDNLKLLFFFQAEKLSPRTFLKKF